VPAMTRFPLIRRYDERGAFGLDQHAFTLAHRPLALRATSHNLARILHNCRAHHNSSPVACRGSRPSPMPQSSLLNACALPNR
jgi:hypothetical protein